MEAPRAKTRTITVCHHALDGPQQTLKITQQPAFKVAQFLRVRAHGLHLVERPFPVALVDRLTQRCWSAEVAVGQEFNLTDTYLDAGERPHEVLKLLGGQAVYAHKRP